MAGAGAGLLGVTACGPEPPPPGPPAEPVPESRVPPAAPVVVERLHSAARETEVDLVLISPEGVPPAGLPVCLALHGRGASARTYLTLGLPAALTAAVRAGTPPFVVAAVDGDHYWVRTDSADDPQRMLGEELPGWLDRRALGAPAAVFGISMGAFGALRYARDRPGLRAVGACSPALFGSWGDAKARKVFRDREQWEAEEPLRHTAALTQPLGVWCGTGDPFLGVARQLNGLAHPAVAEFAPGAHQDDYWTRTLPRILRFTGEHLHR